MKVLLLETLSHSTAMLLTINAARIPLNINLNQTWKCRYATTQTGKVKTRDPSFMSVKQTNSIRNHSKSFKILLIIIDKKCSNYSMIILNTLKYSSKYPLIQNTLPCHNPVYLNNPEAYTSEPKQLTFKYLNNQLYYCEFTLILFLHSTGNTILTILIVNPQAQDLGVDDVLIHILLKLQDRRSNTVTYSYYTKVYNVLLYKAKSLI